MKNTPIPTGSADETSAGHMLALHVVPWITAAMEHITAHSYWEELTDGMDQSERETALQEVLAAAVNIAPLPSFIPRSRNPPRKGLLTADYGKNPFDTPYHKGTKKTKRGRT